MDPATSVRGIWKHDLSEPPMRLAVYTFRGKLDGRAHVRFVRGCTDVNTPKNSSPFVSFLALSPNLSWKIQYFFPRKSKHSHGRSFLKTQSRSSVFFHRSRSRNHKPPPCYAVHSFKPANDNGESIIFYLIEIRNHPVSL